MPARFASSVLIAGAALLLAGGGAPGKLAFDTEFGIARAPSRMHAQVLYHSRDGVHRLELWRQGERLLRRDTEGRLTTIIEHRPGAAGYRLELFDHRRKLRTVIDRDSLYRIGQFTDWTDLAHGLRHPAGAYRLRALDTVNSAVRPVLACRWYELVERSTTTRICWSTAQGFPVQIVDAQGKLLWRTLALDNRPFEPAVFHPGFPGYILNDASRDVTDD